MKSNQIEEIQGSFGPVAIRALAVGAQSVGAIAVGAVALSAVAIGFIAIGRLVRPRKNQATGNWRITGNPVARNRLNHHAEPLAIMTQRRALAKISAIVESQSPSP